MRLVKLFSSLIVVFLPWKIKRLCLVKFWNHEIHPSANIGFSYIFPDRLIMKENSKIGHFNVGIHLNKIEIGEFSSISRSNWITGFPNNIKSKHFDHQPDRKGQLIIGKHSAITKNHHLDCTNEIKIGDFVTIAGYQSQFLTHSINIEKGIQDSNPIKIGDYCFVSTNCVILGGAKLPSFSVLGAKSLLNKIHSDSFYLYGGVPAKKIKELSKDSKYFTRKVGYIN